MRDLVNRKDGCFSRYRVTEPKVEYLVEKHNIALDYSNINKFNASVSNMVDNLLGVSHLNIAKADTTKTVTFESEIARIQKSINNSETHPSIIEIRALIDKSGKIPQMLKRPLKAFFDSGEKIPEVKQEITIDI